MKIRPLMAFYVRILFLLIFEPSLEKGVEIFFCFKLNHNRRDGFAILALVLLSRHEAHVRVDPDAQAR